MDDGRAIVGIGQGIDQAAVPIEVVCGHVLRHIRQVFGQAGHLGIHRQHRVEAGRAEADPLNALGLFRHPIANLANGHHTGAVNANGPVNALSGVLCLGIGVIGCTLIVGRENVLHVLHRHLALRHKGPGDVVTGGRKIRMLPFPAVAGGAEHLAHKPGPGGIVNMVGIRVGAEAVPGIEHAIVAGVQVVLRNEGLQIPGAQVFPALAKGIRKIKPIQSELVGHNDAFVVRHPAGNPVVTADGLHPPDLFVIVEGNAIGLISTVLLQELSQPHNALPGRMDIGQHQNHQVLLADSPRDVLLPAALGLPVLHHGVRPQNSGIGRDGLRGGHAHVGLVDARCGPNTLGPVHIGHKYFMPFMGGFKYAEAGDKKAFSELLDGTVCAVILEVIQGEGGVVITPRDYIEYIRELCDENDIVLIFDEVQTGVGRTGKLYAWENIGVKPDVLTSAKGLGGGLPIGACLAKEQFGSVLTPGTHGTTFGGNPVVLSGAVEILNRLDEEFLKDVREKGEYIRNKVSSFKDVSEVRGMGLMIGIDLKNQKAADVAARCVENGLLILTAKQSLRMLPPLTITYDEIDRGLEILEKTLSE